MKAIDVALIAPAALEFCAATTFAQSLAGTAQSLFTASSGLPNLSGAKPSANTPLHRASLTETADSTTAKYIRQARL